MIYCLFPSKFFYLIVVLFEWSSLFCSYVLVASSYGFYYWVWIEIVWIDLDILYVCSLSLSATSLCDGFSLWLLLLSMMVGCFSSLVMILVGLIYFQD